MANPTNFEAHLEEGIGRLQDGLDGFVGDTGTTLSGRLQGAGGVAQRGMGEILDTLRDVTADRPLFALFGASVLGFLASVFLRRRA